MEDKRKNTDLVLERYRQINSYQYSRSLVTEQELPAAPEEDPNAAAAPEGEALPPEDTAADPMAAETDPLAGEGAPEDTGDPLEAEPTTEDDTTEEIDITDLVNMVKDVKKGLDAKQEQNPVDLQRMDDIFSKLGELEGKLGEMDQVLAKIDALGAEVQEMKPKTPVEKLEMRSIDSYPFNEKPKEFFEKKQQEMRDTGKNEYVLTKQDVENYGKYDMMKSFNPSTYGG